MPYENYLRVSASLAIIGTIISITAGFTNNIEPETAVAILAAILTIFVPLFLFLYQQKKEYEKWHQNLYELMGRLWVDGSLPHLSSHERNAHIERFQSTKGELRSHLNRAPSGTDLRIRDIAEDIIQDISEIKELSEELNQPDNTTNQVSQDLASLRTALHKKTMAIQDLAKREFEVEDNTQRGASNEKGSFCQIEGQDIIGNQQRLMDEALDESKERAEKIAQQAREERRREEIARTRMRLSQFWYLIRGHEMKDRIEEEDDEKNKSEPVESEREIDYEEDS